MSSKEPNRFLRMRIRVNRHPNAQYWEILAINIKKLLRGVSQFLYTHKYVYYNPRLCRNCTYNEDGKLKFIDSQHNTLGTRHPSVKSSTIAHNHLKLLCRLSSAQGHSEDHCDNK